MQFDRRFGDIRLVNAGSVGMPYGRPGAYWALLSRLPELGRPSARALWEASDPTVLAQATQDPDDLETIRATSRFVVEHGIDTVQFMVLTPLPGTPVYTEMNAAGRLLTSDWSLYDAHHSVFRPQRMSAHDLTAETMNGMGKVYSPARIAGMALGGDIKKAILNLYARKQVKRWRKENRKLLEDKNCNWPRPSGVAANHTTS